MLSEFPLARIVRIGLFSFVLGGLITLCAWWLGVTLSLFFFDRDIANILGRLLAVVVAMSLIEIDSIPESHIGYATLLGYRIPADSILGYMLYDGAYPGEGSYLRLRWIMGFGSVPFGRRTRKTPAESPMTTHSFGGDLVSLTPFLDLEVDDPILYENASESGESAEDMVFGQFKTNLRLTVAKLSTDSCIQFQGDLASVAEGERALEPNETDDPNHSESPFRVQCIHPYAQGLGLRVTNIRVEDVQESPEVVKEKNQARAEEVQNTLITETILPDLKNQGLSAVEAIEAHEVQQGKRNVTTNKNEIGPQFAAIATALIGLGEKLIDRLVPEEKPATQEEE